MVIVFFEPQDGGAGMYRMWQPMIEMHRRGHQIRIVPRGTDIRKPANAEKIARYLHGADVLFINYTEIIMNELFYVLQPIIEKEANETGKRLNFVVDCDDDLFSCNPYNEAYRHWGRKNYQVNDGVEIKWLWKSKEISGGDKSKEFDIERNEKLLKKCLNMMKNAAMTFVTTDKLKKRFARFVPNITVAPNAMDFEIFNDVKDVDKMPKEKNEIRIGWSFGHSHFLDWCDIREPLREIMEEFPNVKLCLLGREIFGTGKIDRKQIINIDWAKTQEDYYANLVKADLDIGICPLSDLIFNKYKSPLKWEEYSAVKVPSVVSNVLYKDFVEHRKTGLIYKSADDFKHRLRELIGSPELRKELGNNAYNEVRNRYDIKKIGDIYETTLSNVVKLGGIKNEKMVAC
jgi:glycosyltransferase involved in cell wall biosynthesis